MNQVLSDEWQQVAVNSVAHAAAMCQATIQEIACRYASPSAIYRPAISIDGNMWCALYGANLQDGVAGFGESPALAMASFDEAWVAKLGAAT
jgi:hypothetical protein